MTAVAYNTVLRRTHKAGENLGGVKTSHDMWKGFTFTPGAAKAAVEQAVKDTSSGETKGQKRLRTSNPEAKAAILKLESEGFRVERAVTLGERVKVGTAEIKQLDSNGISQQLIEIERDLRAGRRVKVTITSTTVAEIAGGALSKLLRQPRFTGHGQTEKELLKVYVAPAMGEQRAKILSALGPRLGFKSAKRPGQQEDTSQTGSRWQFVSRLANRFTAWLHARQLRAVRSVMNTHTPYEQAMRAAVNTHLERADKILQTKLSQLSGADKSEVKPLTIKVTSTEQLTLAVVELHKLAKAYNKPNQPALLEIVMSPEVKKFYKEVVFPALKAQEIRARSTTAGSGTSQPSTDEQARDYMRTLWTRYIAKGSNHSAA